MSNATRSLVWVTLLFHSVVATAKEPLVIHGDQLKPRQPQLAVAEGNVVHLAFGSGNQIYHCSSADDGQSFGEPILVGEVNSLSLGMRRGPRIAVTKDNIIVTAIGGKVGGGRDGNLLAWHSGDAGEAWKGPVRVNDEDASAREGLHATAAGPGVAYSVWLDLRNKQTEVMGARSRDGGKSWSKNTLIYRSPDGSVCECCQPSVTLAPDGTLFVMWRNSVDGNRDMYVAKSTDGGQTFEPALQLSAGHWQLDACPMDGGAFVVTNNKEVVAVWRRDKSVFLTHDQRHETKLGDGQQPWLAVSETGPLVTWLVNRPGDLMVKLPNEREPVRLATAARDPVCVVTDSGHGAVVVAWETEEKGTPAIRILRLDRVNAKRLE